MREARSFEEAIANVDWHAAIARKTLIEAGKAAVA